MAIDKLGGDSLTTDGLLGFDDNTLVVDGVDNQVGIGVTPESKLHVHGLNTLLSSDSYFIAQIQTDANDDGSNDDAILQFVNGSAKTVKGELRWDESSNTFELGCGDNQGHFAIGSTGEIGINTAPETTLLGTGTTSDNVVAASGLNKLSVQGSVVLRKNAATGDVGYQPNLTLLNTAENNAPGPDLDLRRESTTPAENDNIGRINFIGRNDAGEDVAYGKIQAKIRDATNGSEDASLTFNAVRAGGVVNFLEYDTSHDGAQTGGEVRVNPSNLDIDFRVSGNTEDNLFVVDANGSNIRMGEGSTVSGSTTLTIIATQGRAVDTYRPVTSSTNHIQNWYSDVGGVQTIQQVMEASGDIESRTNSFGGMSDRTLKENITDATSQWDDIKALDFKNYNFIGDPDLTQLGVIAQDVEAAGMTGLVKTNEETGKMSVKYSVLYMKAVIALQEAMEKIETLETKVTALENA